MKEIWTTEDLRAAASGQPTRRRVLQGGAAAIAGGFLAPLLPGIARASGLGELKLLAWEGFTFEEELKEYLAEKGIDLAISAIASQDDVQIRLAGPTPTVVDVTSYNQGYAELYGRTLNIIQPLDEARLPNYSAETIFPEFYHQPAWYWDGQLQGVVMGWGINCIVCNPAKVPEPASYADLLKPEYAGQIAFVEDPLANWPIFARLTGFGDKYPNVTRDELAQIFEGMKPWRDQSKVFAASIGDVINLFVNGEIGVLFCGWSGIPVETGAQGVETRYVVPAEGGAIWSDAFFIPSSAENLDAAYAFIDGMIAPQAQADHARLTLSGTINKAALPLMDDTTRALFDYDNLADLFARSPLPSIPPLASDEFATFDDWVQANTDFKVGF